ncbi:hypothetical protein RCO28_20200 [Streptomyces sp. LHD-70]|uniref:hypothetical protein n=1 Tax=Streptomyces sp. LHD-70 TaxID=3072140 RepID=UPI00280D229B|nr:hypothetical protein [Streptomyces sp. LHD-70]MDQ8704796.1 hypothetical protein [Streptomyces sp. LHD-70]
MAITDDIRKTFSDPTPFYFAAGTADLAVQQAKKVPALIEKLQAEAPARFEAVRSTDPKEVQEKATAAAKEAQESLQAKVSEVLGSLDTDIRKFGETAQGLALRGVGVAAEYAVKAREKYEEVAEHGELAVKVWRGEAADEIEEIAAAVEPQSDTKAEAKTETGTEAKSETAAARPVAVEDESKPAAAKNTATASTASTSTTSTTAKKAPAKKTMAKKPTPPAK